MVYKLPPLPYPYDALEPFIDKETMFIHHTKHHQAYVDNLNKTLSSYPFLANENLEKLLENIVKLDIPEDDKTNIKNYGGGHINHSFFWKIMSPQKQMDKLLIKRIKKVFSSLEKFKEMFTKVAMSHFGSGWAWLVEDKEGNLVVYSTPNQDSPLLRSDRPLIGIDLWEHAYYLKYRASRIDYINAWWNVFKFF